MTHVIQYSEDITSCEPRISQAVRRGSVCYELGAPAAGWRRRMDLDPATIKMICGAVPASQGGIMAYGAATGRTGVRDRALVGTIISNVTVIGASDIECGYPVLLLGGSATSSPCVITPNPQESSLAKAIDAAWLRATFDDAEAQDFAIRARDAATAFVRVHLPHAQPIVMVSDEGAIMLQWRRDNTGALLVFHGDGTATYSIKVPGGSYSTGVKELPLGGALPDDLREAIARLENPAR